MGESTTEKVAPERTRRPSPLARLIGRSEYIDTWLNYFGMTFTMLLMLLTVVQVTARQVFHSPFQGYIDSEEMAMALLVFLSAAYCQLKGGNIRFELFMTGVLKRGPAYHAAEVLYLLIALTGFALIAIFSSQGAIHAYVIQDVTMSAHWPVWPVKMGVAIGSIFLCIRFIIQIVQNLTLGITGKEIAREMWME